MRRVHSKSFHRVKRICLLYHTNHLVTTLSSEQFPQNEGITAERLGEEYKVSPATIERDGQFAAAVDTLATTVGPAVREEVLERPANGEKRPTRRKVVETATAIEEHRIEPLPFMQRGHWKA